MPSTPSLPFDFGQIAVPFRMQPGLRRLGAGARHLTALDAGSPMWREKKRVFDAGASRLAVPGFDEGPIVDAILARGRTEGLATADEGPPELAFEQDFALLDGTNTTLPWLCVCVPSHWAPEDKLGQAFAAVHAPVADNPALLAAAGQLVQLVTGGGEWERFVWTISPSGRFDQHPGRHARPEWPAENDPSRFAAQCFFRAERQTFFPLGDGSRRAVFTIRVMLQPLAAVVDTPAKALQLHGALASMSDAVLAYKNLATARAPLLRWLAERH
ncbi:DUF3445 domain-containing protein [Caenimonas sedimenti]|uniref:DUF3445 domain-containing protein n=1 Tax=Caenimonas sedimenti TaxID=2596921 RepID=A0A562ZVN8_9BURK|nr:heme-dependent oxidative N-demethylase subunit alpha family protein [Caenimonas sedimenti]TWO72640.1 DUF3445 domain-containing protein [Caenimonas sedimenti]